MDCYISLTLPTIWSPIMPPQKYTDENGKTQYSQWAPYEFRWIKNLGFQIIENITINCGNQQIQKYSGQYLLASALRDAKKSSLLNIMIGHTEELNDPGNYFGRVNTYPNAYYTPNAGGAHPSILSKTLYIPIGAWFSLASNQAFPLVALQYNELQISVTFRPISEWFTIRDVMDRVNDFPLVAPNFNQYYMQFYRFLQTPPSDISLGPTAYKDTRTIWNADINLNCTYCFLSNDEADIFARNEQKYLIKQVYEKPYYNVTGNNRVNLDSLGMVTSWMFYFQRSDVNLRNEWSNYTNWPYDYLPTNVEQAPTANPANGGIDFSGNKYGPGLNFDESITNFFITGDYNPQNIQYILLSMGILLDGQYRENVLPVGVYDFVEKYLSSAGDAPQGLYCYNFCLNTDPSEIQPSGAINMNRFTNVQLEFTTIQPPLDPFAQVLTICDPVTGDIVGVNKPSWRIYDFNYNMYLMEERINIVTFVGGNAGLMYAT